MGPGLRRGDNKPGRRAHTRFIVTETRTVSNDNVVSVDGVLYEVPRGHSGTKVQVLRQTLDETLSILHDGNVVRLHPVDLEANARARRAFTKEVESDETTTPPPRTAAQMAFDRDFGSVVAPTGDHRPPSKDKE